MEVAVGSVLSTSKHSRLLTCRRNARVLARLYAWDRSESRRCISTPSAFGFTRADNRRRAGFMAQRMVGHSTKRGVELYGGGDRDRDQRLRRRRAERIR